MDGGLADIRRDRKERVAAQGGDRPGQGGNGCSAYQPAWLYQQRALGWPG